MLHVRQPFATREWLMPLRPSPHSATSVSTAVLQFPLMLRSHLDWWPTKHCCAQYKLKDMGHQECWLDGFPSFVVSLHQKLPYVESTVECFTKTVLRANVYHILRSSIRPRRVFIPWWTDDCYDVINARKIALTVLMSFRWRHAMDQHVSQGIKLPGDLCLKSLPAHTFECRAEQSMARISYT
jgi:hypothetical protein